MGKNKLYNAEMYAGYIMIVSHKYDDVVSIINSALISPLESFIIQKVNFIREKMRDCIRAGCCECVRVP